MSIANNIEIVPTVSIEHVDQPNVDRTAETLISVTVNPPICIDNPDILNDLPVTPVTNRPENLDDKCDTLKSCIGVLLLHLLFLKKADITFELFHQSLIHKLLYLNYNYIFLKLYL